HQSLADLLRLHARVIRCVGKNQRAALTVNLRGARFSLLVIAPGAGETEAFNVKAQRGLNIGDVQDGTREPVGHRICSFESATPRRYLIPWMANGKTGSIAEAPPSTYSSWPVMKLAWSVHRRTTALPTSAGAPRRLMGVQPLSCQSLIIWNTWGGSPLRTLSSQAPGLMMFTVMPFWARATAK